MDVPTSISGSWPTNPDAEQRSIRAFVWSKCPSLLRWTFLLAVTAVAALVSILIIATGSSWGWVLAWVLAGLLALVVLLRGVLALVLRQLLFAKVQPGTQVDAVLDASGWHSTVGDTPTTTIPWDSYDSYEIWEQYLVLTKSRKASWIPQALLYAPLAAFGADAPAVPQFIEEALRR